MGEGRGVRQKNGKKPMNKGFWLYLRMSTFYTKLIFSLARVYFFPRCNLRFESFPQIFDDSSISCFEKP